MPARKKRFAAIHSDHPPPATQPNKVAFTVIERFQTGIRECQSPDEALAFAAARLQSANIMNAFGFYMVQPEDLDFELQQCWPEESKPKLQHFIESETRSGKFSWALRQNHAVSTQCQINAMEHFGVLHGMGLASHTLGVFVGILAPNCGYSEREVSSILSIFVNSTVYVIEALRLQSQLSTHSHNLEKQVEERAGELRSSRKLLNGVLQSSPNGVMSLSPIRDQYGCVVDFQINLVNKATTIITKRTTSDLVGMQLLNTLPGFAKNGIFKHMASVVTTGNNITIEVDYRHDNINRWLRFEGTPYNEGLTLTITDTTQQREANQALRKSEHSFRAMFEMSPIGMALKDANGTYTQVNDAFSKIIGYPADSIIGKREEEFLLESNQEIHHEIEHELHINGSVRGKLKSYRSSNGKELYVSVSALLMPNNDGTLKTFNIVQDITEQQEDKLQLQEALDAADAANKAKSEFLATMSHEIRTPMNGVIGMTDFILQTQLSDQQRDYVNTIRSSGESLLSIINDILDFSKIEANRLELEQISFELRPLIEDSLDSFAHAASLKDLSLSYEIMPETPDEIVCDPTRLRQVLVNLLNNAIKFTSAGGVHIVVAGEILEGGSAEIKFSVSDTGIGIDKDKRDRLFKTFSQVDTSTTRRYGGTGLGLAICRKLCIMMGGNIEIDSKPDQGSTFTFIIRPKFGAYLDHPKPLEGKSAIIASTNLQVATGIASLAQALGMKTTLVNKEDQLISAGKNPDQFIIADAFFDQATQGIQRLIKISGENTSSSVRVPVRLRSLLNSLQAQVQEVSIPNDPDKNNVPDDSNLRILIAEDNLINQKVLNLILTRLGYQATIANNGQEAVEAFKQERFDIVLMDMHMPEKDGMQAMKEIRKMPGGNESIIAVVTASASTDFRDQCLDEGFDEFIPKPVRPADIDKTIARCFEYIRTKESAA